VAINLDEKKPEPEELFVTTRQTEEDYETENIMRYDQKFLDVVRVWV
tara:strand:+ start:209 stop:349 length:141 start_codon:yes stop_codon:yes gene_type:complete